MFAFEFLYVSTVGSKLNFLGHDRTFRGVVNSVNVKKSIINLSSTPGPLAARKSEGVVAWANLFFMNIIYSYIMYRPYICR